MNIKNINDKKWQTGNASLVDAFSTWVLFDNTQFSISRLRDLELGNFGLTHEQSAILHILNEYGKCTIAELSDIWMRQPHSISTLVNRMAKIGIVEKTKQPKRREIEISITEKGKILIQKVKSHYIQKVFSVLSQDDLIKLSQYMTLLFIRSRRLLGNDRIHPSML
jgi:DNA-binding MarR family transcriptional regulator